MFYLCVGSKLIIFSRLNSKYGAVILSRYSKNPSIITESVF